MIISMQKPVGRSFVFFKMPEGHEYIRKALDKELSYPVKNAEYAQVALADRHARENMARKERGEPILEYPPWDGRNHFLRYSKRAAKWYFPYGLLSRAKKLLSWFDIQTIDDIQFDESEIHSQFEWNGPELRDYQLDVAVKAYSAGHGVVSLPTASGKTIIALRMIWALGLNTVVFVHTRELLKQWCEALESVLGLQISGKEYDAVKVYRRPLDPEGAMVVVAMIQTVHSGMSKEHEAANLVLMRKFDFAILDESHHCPADTFYKVIQDIDAKFKIGLTATPERDDGEDMKMEAALGSICAKLSAEDLIDAGFLAKPIFEFIDVPATQIRGRTFSQVYSSGIVNNEIRNRAIATRVQQLVAEGRQVYIHVEHINHGKILSQMMNAPFIYSKSKDRDETIEHFKKGYIKICISTLLGEGISIPKITALVMGGGRKTEIGAIQKVGRALRVDENTRTAIIVDFCDRGKFLSDHASMRYQSYVKFYGEDIVRGRKA